MEEEEEGGMERNIGGCAGEGGAVSVKGSEEQGGMCVEEGEGEHAGSGGRDAKESEERGKKIGEKNR